MIVTITLQLQLNPKYWCRQWTVDSVSDGWWHRRYEFGPLAVIFVR